MTRFPGLQYDEMLFVNAATDGGVGSESTHFVSRRVFGVPMLLMDYIGALKAWLYTPIFYLFGVSKFTVRAPMVFVHAAAVLVCVLLVRRYTRLWVAAVAALLLCSEPVFALMTRNGMWVGIAGLLRVVAVYGVLRTLESRDARWFALTTCALGFGVFNKLDFILFAGPFLAASAVIFWPSWKDCWRNQRRRLLVSLAALGATYGLAYLYMYRPSADLNRSEASSLLDLFGKRLKLLDDTFAGNTLSLYMTGQGIPGASRLLLCSLVAGASATFLVVFSQFHTDRSTERTANMPPTPGNILALLIATSIGIVMAMTLTPAVSGPHHAAILWPLPTLVIAFSLGAAASLRTKTVTLGVGVLMVIWVCVVVALWTQMTTSAQMASALRNPDLRTSIWSDEVEVAAAVLSIDSRVRAGPQAVVMADWGLGTQIAALTAPQVRPLVVDGWNQFISPNEFVPEQAIPQGSPPGERSFYLVSHLLPSEVFAGTATSAERLLDHCKSLGGSTTTVFKGVHVRVIYVTC